MDQSGPKWKNCFLSAGIELGRESFNGKSKNTEGLFFTGNGLQRGIRTSMSTGTRRESWDKSAGAMDLDSIKLIQGKKGRLFINMTKTDSNLRMD